MNSSEAQSDSDPNEKNFDPEEIDSSEQFFSASLEQPGPKPAFIVDAQENSETHNLSVEASKDVRERAPLPPENNTEDVRARVSRRSESSGTDLSEPSSSSPDWRDLISAKVKHYKTAKPRPERYPSLQLSFESRPSWKPESTAAALPESQSFRTLDPPALHNDPPPAPIPVSNEATARVLEFPRPGILPFNRDELAEPVVDRPRIIEAPELLPPPPALGGILMPEVPQPDPERQPGLDMPLTTARLSRKIFAAAVDGILVIAALAIFGYMFLRFNASLPPLRLSLVLGAVLTAILWFAYQSAFVIRCGTTLGLRAARLRIRRFDGTAVPKNLRRWRVITSILSCVSLGLGYAWCFFDEDELSWHDRMTKTHLAPK